ncbi:MAG TPA: AsmA family protein, partial [Rhodanobacter sp.]|nr:AsmA family protein [Rhodanobacter sp.]
MHIRLKIFLFILAGTVLLACAAGWYVLHNPDRFIPRLSASLQKETGLQVQIQHIEVQLFPTLMVRVYGLKVKNPKPFPSGDFLSVPRLDATLETLPLLHGQIAIRSLFLHKPTIDFISDPDGLWNFQNPSATTKAPAHFSMGTIASLYIENGVLRGSNLVDPADKPGPVVLDMGGFSAQINQTLYHPSNGQDPSTGFAGHLAADTVRFGSIRTRNLQSQLLFTSKQLVFSNMETKTYRGQANGSFSLNFDGKNTTFKTDLKVTGIGVPYVLAEFQKGSPTMTGAMQAQLSLAGEIAHTSSPLTSVHGVARVSIQKGELPKLDKNRSMIEMERFRPPGTGALPASAFSIFTADMELQNN